MHDFGWYILLLVQFQLLACAFCWTMTWPFESRHHDIVVRSKGVYGDLYEIQLSQPFIRLNPRPGERRYSQTCQLGSLMVVQHPHHTTSNSLVCWHRFKVWWMQPVFGETVPPETSMILFQDDHKRYHIVIVGESCSLRQDKGGVVVSGHNKRQYHHRTSLLWHGDGSLFCHKRWYGTSNKKSWLSSW
jgi:hypothetical protein